MTNVCTVTKGVQKSKWYATSQWAKFKANAISCPLVQVLEISRLAVVSAEVGYLRTSQLCKHLSSLSRLCQDTFSQVLCCCQGDKSAVLYLDLAVSLLHRGVLGLSNTDWHLSRWLLQRSALYRHEAASIHTHEHTCINESFCMSRSLLQDRGK